MAVDNATVDNRGLCWCGCGQATPLATQNNHRRGNVKGQPQKYILGHCRVAPIALKQRLAASVEIDDNGCWIWTACRSTSGYGRLSVPGVGASFTHRVAYEEYVGPIPDGLQLDHLCRNRACCNPEHLEPVTSRENTMRGETIPARNIKKTHCPHGHPYDEENTYIGRGGARVCRTCASNPEIIDCPGCGRRIGRKARGLCGACYGRLRAAERRSQSECIRGERDPWSTVDPEWDEAA